MTQSQEDSLFVQSVKSVAEMLGGICSDEFLDSMLTHVNSHSKYSRHPVFPFLYAAVVHALEDRIDDSLEILKYCGEDPFASSLAKYLSATKSLKSTPALWDDPYPIEIWSRTHFCRQQTVSIVCAIDTFAKQLERTATDASVRIVDVGVGDGFLISQIVNRLAETHRLRQVDLVLVDQTDKFLDIACGNCQEFIHVPTTISRVCGLLETLTVSELSGGEGESVWFVNVAACLHHLPRDAKVESLNRLSEVSEACFLTELEGNHDLPESATPELVYSVAQFYGWLIGDLMQSEITDKQKRICLEQFLMPEAALILGSDYLHRGNYHTSFEEWRTIAKTACCDIRGSMIGEVQPGGPRSMTLWVAPRWGLQ